MQLPDFAPLFLVLASMVVHLALLSRILVATVAGVGALGLRLRGAPLRCAPVELHGDGLRVRAFAG